ncbi:MAG: rod shape-determining protein MreD [Alphaproteobacteria bacterium]|nr:rod shape-determining protein MreD [Alphaproteobacteria bacterium]
MALERGASQGTALRIVAALVPLFCGLVFAFVANIPVSLASGQVPPPLLALVPVYFWCLVRPDLMSPAAAFAIGLMEDVLSGGPPGIWTLSFVLTYVLVARQRDSFASLSGLAAVVGFTSAAAFCCFIAWLTVGVLNWHLPPLSPIVGELVMTVLFYAPTAMLVGWLHHRLVGPLRSEI